MTSSPTFSQELVTRILPNLPAMVIVLLIEHLSIAKSFGRLNNYTINPSSEFLAIGITNLVGPLMGAYSASGSFSRTAINSKAGSRTPLAGVFTAGLVVVAIYLLTPMLYFVPNAALSGVIIHAILDRKLSR
jgi:sodium-independent sulfate anion transporter 11